MSLGQIVAQQMLPWRLGPGPGTTVLLPKVMTVQGDSVSQGKPTLVFFTFLDGSSSSYEVAALASAWQTRHPDVQIILVDTRTPSEQVNEWVRSTNIAVKVIADEEEDAFENAFDTNRIPFIYLLDETGVIQDKLVAPDLERLIELDQVLAWATEGDWASIAQQRSEWLTVGEKPLRMLEDISLGEGKTVVIYHTQPFCPPCDEIAQGNFQAGFNQVASAYPEADFIILEPDIEQSSDVASIIALGQKFIELYGRDALAEELLLLIERGHTPQDEPAVRLPEDGWEPNVSYLRYQANDSNNPGRWWGQVLTPGLILFDSEGTYRGIAPLWEGPYNSSSLVNTIDGFLREQ